LDSTLVPVSVVDASDRVALYLPMQERNWRTIWWSKWFG